MQKYSVATCLEVGRVFDSIEEWAAAVRGAELSVMTKANPEKNRSYIQYSKKYKKEDFEIDLNDPFGIVKETLEKDTTLNDFKSSIVSETDFPF